MDLTTGADCNGGGDDGGGTIPDCTKAQTAKCAKGYCGGIATCEKSYSDLQDACANLSNPTSRQACLNDAWHVYQDCVKDAGDKFRRCK